MTISPCRSHTFVDYKYLNQLLLEVQDNCRRHNNSKIVSIPVEIGLVDPLLVFDKFSQKNTKNFYFENRSNGEAIAAIDTVDKIEIFGKNRFIKSEEFIKNCLKNIISISLQNQTFSQPHFFCTFSFFDHHEQSDYPFASATVFLPCWQIVLKNNCCTLIMNTTINSQVNITKLLDNLQSHLEIIKSLINYSITIDQLPINCYRKITKNGNKFKNSVSSILEIIESQHLSKIVLADTLDVTNNQDFNLLQSLNNLRQLHPNCHVFSTSNGQGQNFIGASPERLISIHKQQLITDALAGSAPRGKTPIEDTTNANNLVNNTKEKHEHKLVLDFITQHLSQLGLFPQVLAPRLRKLSNIQHLWTPITAIVPNNIHPLQIISKLHPTPAVAGAARDIACTEIRRYENFERGLYAAPLGWVDGEGNCEFIVGIRSALIDGNYARLYAGAGIVAGSDPQKEFAEVQLKLQALLKALV
ncbi:isochorismate synthase [Dolichospermum circinale]|uniref:isochorismate synthase n=1 Tax=Dolichospermum circinale TaxID=109265 RepID=UPI002330BE5A|nr:isochorismate synthase [Dolichospermum circinale]MDB9453671.1 isochorismate synthase [Dolichospermum circinale CS-541/06]MDB9462709.1 isochorismate synthase [Dolichospermum circinale CS-541/04]MDB9549040.1 isochorismate synthase [Dolichospermum circinale CS-1031]